jgi:hypothetical protein
MKILKKITSIGFYKISALSFILLSSMIIIISMIVTIYLMLFNHLSLWLSLLGSLLICVQFLLLSVALILFSVIRDDLI